MNYKGQIRPMITIYKFQIKTFQVQIMNYKVRSGPIITTYKFQIDALCLFDFDMLICAFKTPHSLDTHLFYFQIIKVIHN